MVTTTSLLGDLKGRKRKMVDKEHDEVKSYLRARKKLGTEKEPLSWWKLHSEESPALSKLAKKYLSICATSVASERLFSISKNIVNPKRTSLRPDKVDKLNFLTCNLE